MSREVWIAGFPGFWGGADTELDHLIDLLLAKNVAVHLVPMFAADPLMAANALARGCLIHEFYPSIFKARVVISFCNQNFLKQLPTIAIAGRPACVIWFNCMTWLFEPEMAAHREGLIDYFGFNSRYQERCLGPLLARIKPFKVFPYRPFFNTDRVTWRYRPWNGSYHLGRISRDDKSKYAPDTWRIFDRVLVPVSLTKRVFVLGYGANARAAIGEPPLGLNVQTWQCNAIPAEKLFNLLDTMIHKTGTSGESYCRVLIEAYAHGVVPIVEEAYAFSELLVHGKTGFMTSESDEMSYLAGVLARYPAEHLRIAKAGRRHLEEEIVQVAKSWDSWAEIL